MKRLLLPLSALLLGGVGFGVAEAQIPPEDLEQYLRSLRQIISERGYSFTVGDNPALHRPLDQLTGYVPPDPQTLPTQPLAEALDLPTRWDWREHNGVTPVRDQGPCGSCWAFATTAAMESAVMIATGVGADLSEQALISCNKSGWSCCGGSWEFRYYYRPGAVDETCMPYQADDTVPCDDLCPRKVALTEWYNVATGAPTVEEIKTAIYQYGPVGVQVCVGPLFGAYTGEVFDADEGDCANHAVVLVGWDDSLGDHGAWILKNSWSTGWGDDGFMYITYGTSGVDDFAIYPVFPGAPNVRTQSTTILDSCAFGGTGDGNGALDPGETALVSVVLKNQGAVTATGVTATLTAADPAINIEVPTRAYPDLEPMGGTAEPVVPFIVASRLDAACGTYVAATLQIASDQGAWTDDVQIIVGQPQPHVFEPLYLENFEAGNGGYQSQNDPGLWHRSSDCSAAPGGHSGAWAMYYGQDGICNYDTGSGGWGWIISPDLYDLVGTTRRPLLLTFKYLLETDQVSCGDYFSVYSQDYMAGPFGYFLTVLDEDSAYGGSLIADGLEWRQSLIYDISGMDGNAGHFHFEFSSRSQKTNTWALWWMTLPSKHLSTRAPRAQVYSRTISSRATPRRGR